MNDTNTARCLYSEQSQDPADTLVTEPVREDVGDTQEQNQEDVENRLQIMRQQILGSPATSAPAPQTAPSAPPRREGLRSVRPAEERADWMSHTRPDPPGVRMLADLHYEAPADQISTREFQQQRQAPDLASLRFASQGEPAPAPAPANTEPEPDPLACWDPQPAASDPPGAAPALPEQPAPQFVIQQPVPCVAPVPEAAPQPVLQQPAPYIAPVPQPAVPQPAPYVAPAPEPEPQPVIQQPAPQVAPAPQPAAPQPAPYVAPAPEAAPQPVAAAPAPVMFPGADMNVDASLEEDIDLYLYGKKRRWPWIVALVALAVAVGVAALVFGGEEPKKPWAGQVEVVSLPAGAEVAMDGKSLGTTPIKVPLARPGAKHEVTVTKSGHETWKDKFTVTKEQPKVRLLAILD